MLVADTLLVALHTFDSKEPIVLVEPAAVKLAVGDDEQENNADEDLKLSDMSFEFQYQYLKRIS